ncbi:hypothetical protein ACIHDR_48630 [Nocardia sp. NPDC052278]|uniref:hypothetical protein n=1 Tax=unclassified Nocardia TaxID=2637762 RepID=UPI0036C22F42
MKSLWTIRQAAEWVVELGLADTGELQHFLKSVPYLEYPCVDSGDIHTVLIEFGILYGPDANGEFGGPPHWIESLCREELQAIASASRGKLAITDVELIDSKGDYLLRFHCNRELQQWALPRGGRDNYAALDVFLDRIGELVPVGSSERWCSVEPTPDNSIAYVFGDPAVLRAVGGRFGITFKFASGSPDLPRIC